MRNNNDYSSYNDGFGGGNGQPSNVIAPTFIQPNPATAPYAAPIYGGNGGIFGGENGLLGGILAASLFGRGFGDRGRDCAPVADCDANVTGAVFGASVLGKLGDISGAIPLAASNIQNGLLEQTIGLNNTINQSSLANLAAVTGVKDAVQNSSTAILLNASQNTQAVLGAICNLSSKIDQNRISELETQLSESRHVGRARDIEVNVTQNQNQLQAQAQQQAQLNGLFGVIGNLANDLQYVRQSQSNINFGVQGTAGQTASASNTKVA